MPIVAFFLQFFSFWTVTLWKLIPLQHSLNSVPILSSSILSPQVKTNQLEINLDIYFFQIDCLLSIKRAWANIWT